MKISSENKIKPTRGTVTSSYFSNSDRGEKVWSSTVNPRSENTCTSHRQKGQGKVRGGGKNQPGEQKHRDPPGDSAPGAARLASETVLIPRRGRSLFLYRRLAKDYGTKDYWSWSQKSGQGGGVAPWLAWKGVPGFLLRPPARRPRSSGKGCEVSTLHLWRPGPSRRRPGRLLPCYPGGTGVGRDRVADCLRR